MNEELHPLKQHEQIMNQLRLDVDDHENRLRVIEKALTEQTERTKTLYETVGAIKVLIEQLSGKMDKFMDSVEAEVGAGLAKLESRIQKLEAADGEKYRQVIVYVIEAVIGLVLGFIFGKLLK
jgi:predicted RNase H-like nuclease (RuvC/YqgF family)